MTLATAFNFRLTRRVKGKTVTETFPSPAALRKAKQEVAEFHRFQTLCGEIVEISEKICALRPVADTLTPEEKTAEAIHAEIAREVATLLGRIFAEQKQTGGLDLEAVGMGFRAALHQAGAAALSELLQFETPPPDRRQLRCGCGHQAQYQELRSRPVLTVLGWTRVTQPGICVSTAMKVSFPTTSHWISKRRTFPRGCAACRPLSGKRLPSITVASR